MKAALIRRLTRLEAAGSTAENHGHEHLLCFVDPDKRVVSTLLLKAGHPAIWTYAGTEQLTYPTPVSDP